MVNRTQNQSLLCGQAQAPYGLCLEFKCIQARITKIKFKLLKKYNRLRALL